MKIRKHIFFLPTPPSPCDLPPIECDSNVFNETSYMCGKTVHAKQDIFNHIHSIDDLTFMLNDCSNIANNNFKSLKLSSKNKPPNEHILICDICTRYVPIGAQKHSSSDILTVLFYNLIVLLLDKPDIQTISCYNGCWINKLMIC